MKLLYQLIIIFLLLLFLLFILSITNKEPIINTSNYEGYKHHINNLLAGAGKSETKEPESKSKSKDAESSSVDNSDISSPSPSPSRPYANDEGKFELGKLLNPTDDGKCLDSDFPYLNTSINKCVQCFPNSWNCLTGFQTCRGGLCVQKRSPQCRYYPTPLIF